MTSIKILIDANIVIGLEDDRPIDQRFSSFVRKCSEHGIRLFVGSSVREDIKQDKDSRRRSITLSKLEKFELLRPLLFSEGADARFGSIGKENDARDVELLVTLDRQTVDFLVTQDGGIHRRAAAAGLARKVLTIEDALSWIEQSFDPKEIQLPFIAKRKAYEIDRSDAIFESLREGYPGFDRWFDTCVQDHRDCWVVEVGRELAGIIIRKTEDHAAANTRNFGKKILKICTFKMKPEYRGQKFGEHLLKQALWFAHRNRYDLVYLTAFEDQEILIDLLVSYGFEKTLIRSNGEFVLEKVLSSAPIEARGSEDIVAITRKFYPRFYDGSSVRKFCIPIQPQYHRKLFPEIAAAATSLPLFPESEFGPMMALGPGERTPGNTIRKVYLCRAQTQAIRPGSVIFFYMSKDDRFRRSQSLTSVGVVEQLTTASTLEMLIQVTAKRSVFSVQELNGLLSSSDAPLRVIDFLLIGHLEPPIGLDTLLSLGIFNRRPPQTIQEIDDDGYSALRQRMESGEWWWAQ